MYNNKDRFPGPWFAMFRRFPSLSREKGFVLEERRYVISYKQQLQRLRPCAADTKDTPAAPLNGAKNLIEKLFLISNVKSRQLYCGFRFAMKIAAHRYQEIHLPGNI